jgi:hypothetical protein
VQQILGIGCLYVKHPHGLARAGATRIVFLVMPIIFGALASWEILKGDNKYEYLTATTALVAGIVPAVYAALKLDEHLPTAVRLAGEYKNLETFSGTSPQ